MYTVVKPKPGRSGRHPRGTILVNTKIPQEGVYFPEETWEVLTENQQRAFDNAAAEGRLDIDDIQEALPADLPPGAKVAYVETTEEMKAHMPHPTNRPDRCPSGDFIGTDKERQYPRHCTGDMDRRFGAPANRLVPVQIARVRYKTVKPRGPGRPPKGKPEGGEMGRVK